LDCSTFIFNRHIYRFIYLIDLSDANKDENRFFNFLILFQYHIIFCNYIVVDNSIKKVNIFIPQRGTMYKLLRNNFPCLCPVII